MPATTEPTRWRYQYATDPSGTPSEKQVLAHQTEAKEILYGGAAGGGKTDWLLATVIRPILQYGVNGLILRRTFTDLNQSEGIIDRLRTRLRGIGTYNQQFHRFTFVNDAVLFLGYLRHDGDVMQYMGAQFGVIGWDQVEQFTEWQYRRMFHPLRVHAVIEAQGYSPFMAATANPGGPGHHWVKDRWIDPAPPFVVWQPTPTPQEPNPGSRVFIPARLEDNPGLGADYEAQLEGLPEDDREALRWGNWDVYAGARFGKLWRRDIHVIDPEDFPIAPGAGVPRALGVDYGMDNPWCALWGALFPDNLVVIYRELYQAGLSPAQQAEAIRDVERAAGERTPGRPMPTALDPSCWARNPNEPGPQVKGRGKTVGLDPNAPPKGSIADTYRINGVPVLKANNDRLTGAALVASKLKVRGDGRPRLLVYSTCINLIRTLPGLPRDPKHPEDVDTKAEDHAYDALRYLLMLLDPGAPSANPGAAGDAGGGDRLSRAQMRTETAGLRHRPM